MVLCERVSAGKGLQGNTRNASGASVDKIAKLGLRNGTAYTAAIAPYGGRHSGRKRATAHTAVKGQAIGVPPEGR